MGCHKYSTFFVKRIIQVSLCRVPLLGYTPGDLNWSGMVGDAEKGRGRGHWKLDRSVLCRSSCHNKMKQPCLIIIWTNGVIIFGIKIKINSSFAMGYVAGAIWIGIWQVEKYLNELKILSAPSDHLTSSPYARMVFILS